MGVDIFRKRLHIEYRSNKIIDVSITLIIVVAVLLIAGISAASAKTWGYYDADYISNYDGDSITASFEVWPGVFIVQSVRLNGIDTPEIKWRAKCDRERDLGERAKSLIEKTLSNAKDMRLRVYKKGKFGRLLVDIIADGVDVASLLIKKGLARPYDGGKRQGWC